MDETSVTICHPKNITKVNNVNIITFSVALVPCILAVIYLYKALFKRFVVKQQSECNVINDLDISNKLNGKVMIVKNVLKGTTLSGIIASITTSIYLKYEIGHDICDKHTSEASIAWLIIQWFFAFIILNIIWFRDIDNDVISITKYQDSNNPLYTKSFCLRNTIKLIAKFVFYLSSQIISLSVGAAFLTPQFVGDLYIKREVSDEIELLQSDCICVPDNNQTISLLFIFIGVCIIPFLFGAKIMINSCRKNKTLPYCWCFITACGIAPLIGLGAVIVVIVTRFRILKDKLNEFRLLDLKFEYNLDAGDLILLWFVVIIILFMIIQFVEFIKKRKKKKLEHNGYQQTEMEQNDQQTTTHQNSSIQMINQESEQNDDERTLSKLNKREIEIVSHLKQKHLI